MWCVWTDELYVMCNIMLYHTYYKELNTVINVKFSTEIHIDRCVISKIWILRNKQGDPLTWISNHKLADTQ